MSYEVTSTRQVQRLLPGGETPVTLYQAWIRTVRGSTGFVLVSPDKWVTDELRTILAAKAKELDRAFEIAEE